jgi:hypothetical protein
VKRVLALAIGLCAAIGMTRAADSAPGEKTGLKVGEKAPAFALKDQGGKERALKELLEDGPVALVFYRSASW